MMRQFYFMSTVLCLLLMLGGCSLHHPIAKEIREMPAAFSEDPSEKVEISLGYWWEDFEDPTLSALIEEVVTGNLDVTQAYARLSQLQSVAAIREAARKPSITMDGQANRSSQPTLGNNATGNSYRLSVAAGYELDVWQKLAASSSAARIDVQAADEDIKTLFLTLTAQVADLYYLAVEQRAQLALLDKIIVSYNDTVTLVEARYNQGQSTATDVYLSRQSLAAVRSRRPPLQALLATIEHDLATLAGTFHAKNIAGIVTILPAAPEAYPAGIPSDLLQNRPDIRAGALRLAAQDKRLAAAIADQFPSFNLLADYGYSETSITSLITGSYWDLILKAALPVIDGGRRRAEVQRNQAKVEEELASFQKIVLQAFQEVEDALANNKASEERVTLLIDQLAISNISAELTLRNYQQGINDYLFVLLAQRAQMETETQLLNARRQLISDRISLIRSLGGKWTDDLAEMRNKE
jgi:NodT family efflux transporter outer membrane factor (OMF) lipoprotein